MFYPLPFDITTFFNRIYVNIDLYIYSQRPLICKLIRNWHAFHQLQEYELRWPKFRKNIQRFSRSVDFTQVGDWQAYCSNNICSNNQTIILSVICSNNFNIVRAISNNFLLHKHDQFRPFSSNKSNLKTTVCCCIGIMVLYALHLFTILCSYGCLNSLMLTIITYIIIYVGWSRTRILI